MTDTSEPWPPVPGYGPASTPGTPPPVPPDLPQEFHAPPDWFPQTPSTQATPPTSYVAQPSTSYGAQPPSAPLPADQVTAPAPPRRRRGGLVLIVALLIVGLGGVLGGGALLAKELTRKATKAEQAAALATEIASRWQRLAAGKIFPATVSYTNADDAQVTMTRVGIVPQASCRSALEPTAFQQIHAFGCVAILRATYIDDAGTQAVTVGIAAFPDGQAAQQAQSALKAANARGSLYAVPISGTIADAFGNAQRGAGDAWFVGSYVLLYTAGYTDGMPASAASTNDELTAMGVGVLAAIEPTFTKHPSPCTMKDIKC